MLYEALEAETLPYVLARQRANNYKGVQSVFDIAPMTHGETQRYFTRRASEQENRRAPVDKQADNVNAVDVEQVRKQVRAARNIFKDSDELTTPDDLGRMFERMSWNDLQELLTAATNRSILEDGAGN